MSIQAQLSQDSKTHLLSECFAVHSDLVNIRAISQQTHLLPMSDSALVGLYRDGFGWFISNCSAGFLRSLFAICHSYAKNPA